MSTKDYLEKDYYKALGVAKRASQAEIKKAYRKLARELHPDTNPGDAKAEARFKEVSEAYDVLSDAGNRKEYDEARSLFGGGVPASAAAGSAASAAAAVRHRRHRGGPPSTSATSSPAAGGAGGRVGDMFGGLFGGRGGRSRHRHPGAAATTSRPRSPDFAEAVRGRDPAAAARQPARLPDLPRHRRPARHRAADLPGLPRARA